MFVEFFVVKNHLRDGVLFLLDVEQALTTKYAEGMAQRMHAVDRGCSVLFGTKSMMTYVAFTGHLTFRLFGWGLGMRLVPNRNCIRLGPKPGLWTVDWNMDWNMDWIVDSVLDSIMFTL